ncbi:MAG: SMP-30/gluconolactonase/LRE family protein [Hyphomonas sp.]
MAPTGCILGQGAVWSPSEGFLWWVDHKRAKLHRHNPRTGNTRRYDMSIKAAALALCDGALLMAGEQEIGLYDPATEAYTRWVVLEDEPAGACISTGGVAPDGSFWFATKDRDQRDPIASYYRMGADRRPERIRMPSVMKPTGMQFSPDGKTLTTCDTTEHEILQYGVGSDVASVTGRSSLAFTVEEGGQPHDVALDQEGGVWTCISGGSRLIRYSRSGEVDQVVALAAPYPTACVFGGPDMRTLFIVTSREEMSFTALDARPLSGSLFALNVDVPGVPHTEYLSN